MNENELDRRIQSVLDGDASPEEAGALERRLAADAAARERFEELRALFGELAGVHPAEPPAGLERRVIDEIAARPPTARQLSGRGPVIAPESDVTRGAHPGPATLLSTTGDNNMSDKSFFGNRKALIGSGIAAAAVVFGVYYIQDYPTDSSATSGTIAPAQRYRAQQPTGSDVKLGEQGGAQQQQQPVQSSQQAQGAASQATNAAANQARNAAANQAAGQMSNEAANQARNAAANQAAGQMSNEAANQAANKAANQAANKAASQVSNEAMKK